MAHGVHNDPSKSYKVVDFGTDRKHVWDFLLVLKVILVLFCCVLEILELLYAESHFFRSPPLFHPKFQVFHLSRSMTLGSAESEYPKLTNREIIFEECQPM